MSTMLPLMNLMGRKEQSNKLTRTMTKHTSAEAPAPGLTRQETNPDSLKGYTRKGTDETIGNSSGNRSNDGTLQPIRRRRFADPAGRSRMPERRPRSERQPRPAPGAGAGTRRVPRSERILINRVNDACKTNERREASRSPVRGNVGMRRLATGAVSFPQAA